MKWIRFDRYDNEQVWYSDDEVEKLKAENSRLKAENKQLQKDYDALDACVELLRMKIKVLNKEIIKLNPKLAKYNIEDYTKDNPELANEVIKELTHYLACMTEQRNKYKTYLQKIKEIIENNCWDYTDVTVLAVKDKILQKIAESEGADE